MLILVDIPSSVIFHPLRTGYGGGVDVDKNCQASRKLFVDGLFTIKNQNNFWLIKVTFLDIYIDAAGIS